MKLSFARMTENVFLPSVLTREWFLLVFGLKMLYLYNLIIKLDKLNTIFIPGTTGVVCCRGF